MSWKELSGHMMASHPKVLEAEKRWAKDTRRVWIRAAIPTTVAWFASFILILLSLLSSHVEIILAEIGVAYFVIMGTYFYARHATGTDFEEVRDRLDDSASDFGRLTAVRHAAVMSETPPRWTRAALPLGTHAPAWSGQFQ